MSFWLAVCCSLINDLRSLVMVLKSWDLYVCPEVDSFVLLEMAVLTELVAELVSMLPVVEVSCSEDGTTVLGGSVGKLFLSKINRVDTIWFQVGLLWSR